MSRVVLAAVVTFINAAEAQDVEDVLARLQEKYESMEDASISFTQVIRLGVARSKQSFSGKLWMKKGNRYRIETEQQTIVTDGKTVWTYSDLNKQVFVDTFREDPRTLTPEKVLVAVPRNYSATIIGEDTIGGSKTVVVKLIPKDNKSSVKTMKAWVDRAEWLIRKAEIVDVGDNLTTYVADETRLNTGIANSVFRFTAPPGVEVIDLRSSP